MKKLHVRQQVVIVLSMLLMPFLVFAEESTEESALPTTAKDVERAALATIESCAGGYCAILF